MSTPERADFQYVGGELQLFAAAVTWKRYLRAQIGPYLKGRVLEVGAGLGSTTRALCSSGEREWICLEPDPDMAAHIERAVQACRLPAHCRAVAATTKTCTDAGRFDAILYVDVLEHIAADAAELAQASSLLAPGGNLIVLAPAHQWLFTPFDHAIGHHRRYSRRALAGMEIEGLRVRVARYLDCAGLLASLGNRLWLRRSMPTPRQIRFWDRVLVPVSQSIDPLLAYTVGKSVLVIWEKAVDSG